MANQIPHCWQAHTGKTLNRSTLALAIKTQLQIPLPGIIPTCPHVCKGARDYFTDVLFSGHV